MTFNLPETFYEQQNQSTGNLDTLTREQKSAVEAILANIDVDPEIGKSIQLSLGNQFHEVTHSSEKLGKLLDAIQNTEQAKLNAITSAFNKGEIAGEQAKINARDAVTHYGHLALTALKDSMQTQTA